MPYLNPLINLKALLEEEASNEKWMCRMIGGTFFRKWAWALLVTRGMQLLAVAQLAIVTRTATVLRLEIYCEHGSRKDCPDYNNGVRDEAGTREKM